MLLKVIHLSGTVSYAMFQNNIKLFELAVNQDNNVMIAMTFDKSVVEYKQTLEAHYEAIISNQGVRITKSEGSCVSIETTEFTDVIPTKPLLLEYLEAATTLTFNEHEFLQEEAA